MDSGTGQVFKNRRAALDWLNSQGYKVSVGKFYQDCKQGLCLIDESGCIHEAHALRYAVNHLKQITSPDGTVSPLQEEKTRLEIEALRKKNERLAFEMEKEQGRYILKKDFALEMAARAGVLDTGLRNLLLTRMGDWITMAGGDYKKLQTALEVAQADLDALLNEYASMNTLHVVFKKE